MYTKKHGDGKVLVTLNISGEEQTVNLPGNGEYSLRIGNYTDGSETDKKVSGGAKASLQPWEAHLYIHNSPSVQARSVTTQKQAPRYTHAASALKPTLAALRDWLAIDGPVVDTVPPPPDFCAYAVPAQLRVSVPVCPAAPGEVVDDTLKQGHHQLVLGCDVCYHPP